MKKVAAAVAVFSLYLSTAYGQVGAVDASFGTAGAYTFPFLSGIYNVEAGNILVMPNDELVVSTDDEYASFFSRGRVTQLSSDGALNPSFGTGGSVLVEDSTSGYSNLTQMPNGQILATWHKHTPNITLSDDYPFLTMHQLDGSPVPTFGVNGRLDLPSSLSGGTIGSIAVADALNNLYVLYDFDGGEVIRSYTSTGAINMAFGNNGAVFFANDGTSKMVFSPTSGGRILIARYDANSNFTIGQYLLNGQLDFTFGSAGYVTVPSLLANATDLEFTTIGLQSDGKLLVHLLEYSATQAMSRVARINTNGSLDATFNANAQLQTMAISTQIFYANSLIQQPDGKILLGGGNVDLNTENTQNAFCRILSDGTADAGFGTNGFLNLGTFNNEMVTDVKLQSTGKIVALVSDETSNSAAYVIRLLNNVGVGALDAETFDEISLYPNPAHGSFDLRYDLKASQTITIDLIDSQGRMVLRFQENQKEHGLQQHHFVLPETIAAGAYAVSIRTASTLKNLHLIVK